MTMYNGHMKQVSATEANTHFLQLMAEAAETGEPIMVTKRGKPTLILQPIPQKKKFHYRMGLFADKVKIVGDIVGPIVPAEEWEAMR